MFLKIQCYGYKSEPYIRFGKIHFCNFVEHFLNKLIPIKLEINILKQVKKNVPSKIEQTISALDKAEGRLFRQFLESKFFNQRTDVLKLYDWLLGNPLEPKAATFAFVYGKTDFDGQKLRLVLSYLQKLAEHFLAYQQWVNTSGATERDLVRAVRQRGLDHQFPNALQSAKTALERQSLRNSDYYVQLGLVLWEEARFESLRAPSETIFLEQLSNNADLIWFTQKLRYMCLVRAQQIVYKTSYLLRFRAEIEQMVQQHDLLQSPAVEIWFFCLRMLEEPESLDFFNRFKQSLLSNDHLFDSDEIRDLHLFAVNYCIRRVNVGQRQFFNDIMDFYKNGLLKGYLIENGHLSRFTYHNIVGAGLQTKEYDWTAEFIGKYKNTIERSHRESSYKFNLARLEFAQKRYDVVLPLLQNSNYYDPLIALAAKSLALKIYYETKEYDLLESHLEAMKIYIRRKPMLGYHRSHYLNLVRFTQKLVVLNHKNTAAVAILKETIRNEPALVDREWLLEQFGAGGK